MLELKEGVDCIRLLNLVGLLELKMKLKQVM
jgi:hypothetical protein